ncbi:MAG TPA: outer membrane beta-barrel protein [Vicinamibacterales bacterium]|nr:outer membrane beta-barrel protein [Vicinamibacterales bacterium]
MKSTPAIILALGLCAVPHIASAQTMQWTDKGYVTFNVGAQVGSDDLDTNSTFSLYDETGTVSSTQRVKGGAFFELGGAYRVWGRNVLAGVSFTRMSSDSNVALTASIPDPVFFDRPRSVTASQSGAQHAENAIHLNAIWMMPVANKLDLGIFGGPTIFMVKQDTIGALTSSSVTEPGPAINAPLSEVKKTTAGINFGVDVQYLVRKDIAVGGIARYSWGSVDIDGASGSLGVGGFQIGVGVRYRLK